MKIFRHILLFICSMSFLLSCSNSKRTLSVLKLPNEKLFLDINNSDFSKSAKDAVAYLKATVANTKASSITVQIFSFHNGVIELLSTIQKTDNSLTIKTLYVDSNNFRDTSTKKIDSLDFISQLQDLELNADKEIVIAGTYQKVYIRVDKEEKLFLTRKAYGLLSLLR